MFAMVDSGNSRSRRNVLTAIGALGAAGLAGCGGSNDTNTEGEGSSGGSGSDGGSSSTDTGTATPVPMADSFTLWELSDTWDPHVAAYQDATGTTIDHVNKGSVIEDLRTRILAGTGAPGTSMAQYKNLRQLIATGGLRDISDWVDEAGIRDQFPEGIWETVSQDGAIYEIPYDIGPATLFYRKDVWDEHGVDDSFETYDELIEEGKKLPDDMSIMGLANNTLMVVWRAMYRQAGGQEFDEEGRIAFDNDLALTAFRQINRLGRSGVVDSTNSWSNPWFEGFKDGSIAGRISGAWFAGTLQSSVSSTSGKWRGMKLPALESGGNRASQIGGSGLCFPKQVDEAQARRAFDFVVETTTSNEQMANLFTEEGNICAYKGAWDDDAFSAGYDFFGGQPIGELWTEMGDNIPGFTYTLDSPKVNTLLNPILQDMVAGDLEPKAALDKWVTQSKNQTGRDVA